MQTTFANPMNVQRLTIGITNATGARVEIVLTKTNPAPYAPLAPVFEPTAADAANAAPLCGIHGTPMEWRETKRGAFWSCPQKFANGDWCNYKTPKQ